jgi:hypothetical protein
MFFSVRWNPDNPDDTFFCQSVALYTSFYHLQIQVHRPFLMKRSALSRTSLAMCTSAARSTAHVLEAAMSRRVALFASSHVRVALGLTTDIEVNHVIRCPVSLPLWSCSLLLSGQISNPIQALTRKLRWSSCGTFSLHLRTVKGGGIWLDVLRKLTEYISAISWADAGIAT